MRLADLWSNYKVRCEINPFILMYHRVLENPHKEPFPVQPGMYTSLANFKQNISYLKNNFRVIHLEELLDGVFRGESMGNYCAITFDDGWEDNYFNAFPVLERYKMPAAFFLTTSLIDTLKWFWFDEIAFFVKEVDVSIQIEVFSKFPELRQVFRILKKKISIEEKITKIVFVVKNDICPIDRSHLILDIKAHNRKCGDPVKVMLDWGQVKNMYGTGLAVFYSHSHTHENLNECPDEFIKNDIMISFKELYNNLEINNYRIFCYPSGKCDNSTIQILKTLGIEYSLTTERGFVKPGDKYRVNRIGIHDDISLRLPKLLHKFNW